MPPPGRRHAPGQLALVSSDTPKAWAKRHAAALRMHKMTIAFAMRHHNAPLERPTLLQDEERRKEAISHIVDLEIKILSIKNTEEVIIAGAFLEKLRSLLFQIEPTVLLTLNRQLVQGSVETAKSHETVNRLEKENQQLQEQLQEGLEAQPKRCDEALRFQQSSFELERSKSAAELDSVKSHLYAAETRYRTKASEHEDELRVVSQSLDKANHDLTIVRQSLKVANQELRELPQMLRDANEKLETRDQLLETANHELGELRQSMVHARHELAVVRQSQEMTNHELMAARQSVEEVTRELERVKDTMQLQEAEMQQRVDRIRDLEREVLEVGQGAKQTLTALYAERDELKVKVESLTAERDMLEAEAKETVSDLRKLDETVSASIGVADGRMNALKQQRNKLVEERDMLKAEAKETLSDLRKLDQMLSASMIVAQGRIDALCQQRNDLAKRVKTLSAGKAELEVRAKEMVNEVRDLSTKTTEIITSFKV